ncbi:LysR family transcriptional regulator [Paracoccus caeni]|uniref:LysR family transcriptional regulator n=1 Tax=Paracoccus caeni TaxID=657651 RepID=A0A934SBK9_9RHOB|nr:LysR substrate-binding domain-containing protein [Paracoccus caeni]MBK4214718.1 LysR family transcriptional regulator [Paracoccus caeni]
MDFDLTDLRLFDEVVRAGSITGGAEAAHLSLAAASTRLRDLEIRLGVTLLQRHRRGIRVTAAGMDLHQHALRMLAEARALQVAMRDHSSILRGDLRLVVNTAALHHGLPELLAGYLRGHPGVDLAITELPSGKAAEAVSAARAELGIVADHADLAGLVSRFWRKDRLVVVLPVGDPLAQGGSLRLADIVRHPVIGLGRMSALQRHIDERAAAHGLGPLHLRASLADVGMVLRMVAAGAGLAILPEAVVATHSAELVAVPLDEVWAARSLHLIWRDDGAGPSVRKLIEHIAGGS